MLLEYRKLVSSHAPVRGHRGAIRMVGALSAGFKSCPREGASITHAVHVQFHKFQVMPP